MGLDAHVYKKLSELPEEIQRVTQVYDLTGELSIPVDEDYWKYGDEVLYALHERIGNIAGVGWLSKQFAERFPGRDRPLFDEFLYSATHCGDAILPAQMHRVEEDLQVVRTVAEPPPELLDFVDAVERLVACARERGNAIVF